MTLRSASAVIGMLALAACTGCATASAPPGDASDGNAGVHASPPLVSDPAQACQRNGGWYDRVAGVCDTGGS